MTKALTKDEQYGVLLRTDGKTQIFKNPSKPVYVNKPDGLYWMVNHEQGSYEILASLREGYELMTPGADNGQVDTLQGGWY